MTYGADGWTDWIEHTGRLADAPVGFYVRFETEGAYGSTSFGETWLTKAGRSWDWSLFGTLIDDHGLAGVLGRVVRYRIRKPRGSEVLDQIVRAPEPIEEMA